MPALRPLAQLLGGVSLTSQQNTTGASNYMAIPGDPPPGETLRVVVEVEIRETDIHAAMTMFDHIAAFVDSFEDWDQRVVGGRVQPAPLMVDDRG